MPHALAALTLAAWLALGGGAAHAAPPPEGLAELSIEQLLDEPVTSVAKKRTRIGEAATAVTVITQDDIRRLGITTIPEALRLVPGLEVARVDGSHWAISVRGFNNEFANKLLVLVDGRTVYSPTTAGVYWNEQDVLLEDLDRIEVIRGPGATLWGANAVNGVINVITRSARDTQGAVVRMVVGTEDAPGAAFRHGGAIGDDVFYRAYVKAYRREGLVTAAGTPAPDDWRGARGGFRIDWEQSPLDAVTLQGEYFAGDAEQLVQAITLSPTRTTVAERTARNENAHVLGRWTRTLQSGSQLMLQGYYDRARQGEGSGAELRNTLDLELQHGFALGARHDVLWGAGYRRSHVENEATFGLTYAHGTRHLDLANVFVQDDFALTPDLHFIAGSKFEHGDVASWQIQPNARLRWTPTARQTAWAAVSRATRTPSLFERDARLNAAAFRPSPFAPPVLVSLFGNPDAKPERLTAYELGYRVDATDALTVDIASFYNDYRDLLYFEPNPTRTEAVPAPSHVLVSSTLQNTQSGEAWGAEMLARYRLGSRWQLAAGYSWLHLHLHHSGQEETSPQQQAQLRSYLTLADGLELNAGAWWVDRIEAPVGGGRIGIPDYLRLDVGVNWQLRPGLELRVTGTNLLESSHAEFASTQHREAAIEVPRGVNAGLTWRF